MTRTSDTVRTHLQRCRTLGEGLLKLCAHQSPYTGRTHRLFPPPQAASVRPRFEPTATPPSRATSRGCYRYGNPPPETHVIGTPRVRSQIAVLGLYDGNIGVASKKTTFNNLISLRCVSVPGGRECRGLGLKPKAEKAIYLSVPPLHFDCLKSRPTVSEAQFEFLGEASSCILFS